jgi:hypothetical protein
MAGRGNTANLRPFAKGDERARDAGRAGGLRSAAVRAERRDFSKWAKRNGEKVFRVIHKMAKRGNLAAVKLLSETKGGSGG